MRTTAILSLLLLAGCANNQPPPQPRYLTSAEAQTMPVVDLCIGLGTFGPVSAQVASLELQRRGVNCQDHAQAIQLTEQRRNAALGILMQQRQTAPSIYQPAPAQPYQIPQPTRCTSQWIGGQMQTVCR
jgi:hypothetical protein